MSRLIRWPCRQCSVAVPAMQSADLLRRITTCVRGGRHGVSRHVTPETAELRDDAADIGVRGSKKPDGSKLLISRGAFAALMARLKR
ncbi:DUF397 domain-containing protein [Actinomadura sp. GC306]|nr:DUF397 domain-containing protein [Actinomadura sp. GC306]